jgi:anion-transporting  ArsA/GET3 family ATPase
MSPSRKTQLHFITGKGGVGRSTVAASLAARLSEKREGPVLLVEVQGSGRSLELLGLEDRTRYKNTAVASLRDTWAARILPKETFKQYFNLLLSLGNEGSALAQATASVRTALVDRVLDNKVVSAFVDVCPGLEPATLLGKLHWEATHGSTPESEVPWRHVVVDAPATGHTLMLFRSTNALVEVFGNGIIFRQAADIMRFMRDPALTRLYVVSTVEELPLRESLELQQQLEQLQIKPYRFVLNRFPYPTAGNSSSMPNSDPWKRELDFERENNEEQLAMAADFERRTSVPIVKTPELALADMRQGVRQLATLIAEQGV